MPQTGDQAFIKAMNKSIVLHMLRFQSPMSRVQISNITGLNRATVSSIVDELISDNLIYEIGQVRGKVGRRAVLLMFNAKAGFTIGVDLGVNYVRIALTDLSAEILIAEEMDCPDDKDVQKMAIFLVASIQNMVNKAPDSHLGIIGIGIGVPGLVDYSRGIVFNAPNLGWRSVHLKAILETHLALPVHIDNEANVSALGEKLFGVGKQFPDMIYVSAGTGIGTGIIVKEDIVRGHSGIAGEFGHMTIEINGPKCSCGNSGCLEMYASEKALIDFYQKTTGIRQSADQIIKRVQNSETAAIEAIQLVGQYLGIGIANLINGLNPSLVLVGNRLSKAGDWILRPLEQTIQSRSFVGPYTTINVQLSSLGTNACVIGSAALVLREYFTK